MEVLYSRTGQTADDLIERATHRFSPHGEVLAVTDDYAERDTVISLGAWRRAVRTSFRPWKAPWRMADDIKHHN
jgi:predicted RNA-binding protein with PIN domain